jgi:predicted ATP-dependent endonuclease of OLD family
MYIKKLQVYNYKSYFNSKEMRFEPGINIIIGKNNAGKTSLLEVLTLDFEDHPHKSLMPNKGSTIEDKSRIEITLCIEKEELRNFIKEISSNTHIGIPQLYYDYDPRYGFPHSETERLEEVKFSNNKTQEAFKEFQGFLKNSDLCKLNLTLNSSKQLDTTSLIKLLNFDSYETSFNFDDKKLYKLNYDDNKELKLETIKYDDEYDDQDTYCKLGGQFSNYMGTIEESMGKKLFDIFVSRSYRFKAERLNIGICKFENNNQLKSDASNLAEVLSILPGKKPGTFSEFNKKVSSILDEIKHISVVLRDNSEVEIKVWMTEELNRDDLSFPLSSCGSGVGQVLAIVYILVCSEEPRTLIIDEPQSFLHPGAAKKLIETIKQFPQHQYFIATHSPDIITTADPSNIIKLKYENCQTTASVIDAKNIEWQKEILIELGFSLSDFFGTDNILWVEGKTEQICFPIILEKVLKKQLRGTKILGVMNPADFQGKRASLIFDIYQKLSGGTNLFPPAIGFLFDSDNRTKEEKDKWQKQSGKPVEFLSRRMYENYLLDSEAIAAVFNKDNQSRPEPLPINITSVEVEEWLNQKKQEQELSETEWLSTVDGSQLLTELFRELSGSKLTFHKTREPYKHSYKLTKWLVEEKPDFLSGLAEEIAKMLNYEE